MINRVTLIGNVGKAADIRSTTTGKQVATFTLATSEKYNNEIKTQWHNIVSWSPSAGKIKKGDKLYIEGKLDYRTWDKPDGSKAYKTEIVAILFLFMNSKKPEQTPTNDWQNNTGVQTPPPSPPEDLKLPF